MLGNIWFNIMLSLIIFNFIFSSILEYINDKNWKNYVPDELKEFYPREKYQKARDDIYYGFSYFWNLWYC